MISKETFINIMERLEALDKKMDAVDVAMKNLNNDFCCFYLTEPFDITLDILAETFNDKDEWLSYLVFERDWLRNFKMGDVRTAWGAPIDLSDWGKVYDFLVKNMED